MFREVSDSWHTRQLQTNILRTLEFSPLSMCKRDGVLKSEGLLHDGSCPNRHRIRH
jgi:hypothetical protein